MQACVASDLENIVAMCDHTVLQSSNVPLTAVLHAR